jgi:hypothetical protein
MLAYVQPEAVKTALLDLTDKQVEFSKSVAKQFETAAEFVNTSLKDAAKNLTPNK